MARVNIDFIQAFWISPNIAVSTLGCVVHTEPRPREKWRDLTTILRYSFHKPFRVKLKLLVITSMTKELASNEVYSWLERIANARVHAHTLKRPFDTLTEERKHLLQLPPPYKGLSKITNASKCVIGGEQCSTTK